MSYTLSNPYGEAAFPMLEKIERGEFADSLQGLPIAEGVNVYHARANGYDWFVCFTEGFADPVTELCCWSVGKQKVGAWEFEWRHCDTFWEAKEELERWIQESARRFA